MFWMLICASVRWYHLFSQISREWQLGCSTKVSTKWLYFLKLWVGWPLWPHPGYAYGMITAAPDRHPVLCCWMYQASVPIHRVVVPAPQSQPASHLRSTTRDVSFLRSDSRCRRCVSDLSNVTPRYVGSAQKDRVSLFLSSSLPNAICKSTM